MIRCNYPFQSSPHMKFLFVLLSTSLISISCKSQDPDLSKLIYRMDEKESAYPRLSKNDDQILYQSNANGNWQLNIMDINSGAIRPVMTDNYNNNFPDWSPDNEWVAFTSDSDGNEEIYLMKTNGMELIRLTNDAGRDIHPYFSPDGKSILFNSTRANGSFDVYHYFIENDSLVRLTDSMDDETCARFSPDMKHIVMLKNGLTSDDVFLMDPASGEMKNLSGTPSINDGWPMISP